MRNRYVREKFKEMIHGYPERTPLSPQTVAVHNRDGYRVENVMFQSLPNFWVTGNLHLPTEGKAPFPGVISPCGHYPLARMDPEYQCVYVDLVKAGFVVLAYDPIGQGERRQYWNPETGQTEVAAHRIDAGHLLRQHLEAVETAPHVAWRRAEIDPHRRLQTDRTCAVSAVGTLRSVASSTPRGMRSRQPRSSTNSSAAPALSKAASARTSTKRLADAATPSAPCSCARILRQ